jgi:hypothetical protein
MVGDLIVMAIAASAGSQTVVPLELEFDLAKVRPKEVTCADRTGSVAKPVRAEFTGPLKAETTIHAIQQTSPVATTPAAAVTFKWRF